jgi:hypothetical protein
MKSRHYSGCSVILQGLLFRMRGIVREFKRTPLEGAMRGGVCCAATGGAGVQCFNLRLPKALLDGIERVMPTRECLTDEEVDFIINYGHV